MRPQAVTFLWREVDVVDADGVANREMAMVPLRRYGNVCKRQFGDGGEHTLGPVEERSMASHNQYFASIKSGYDNMPEHLFFLTDAKGNWVLDAFGNRRPKWPSPDHYRYWLLIECGFFVEKEIDVPSELYAKRLMTFIRPECPFARIRRRGATVVIQTAESQSLASMKKARFEESKKATLELNDALTGVSPGTHWKEAGKAL